VALERRANLAGKVAIIVGGGGGIGGAVTLALAAEGVDVAFCDIDRAAMSGTERAARDLGVRTLERVVDATVPEQLAGFYEAFDEGFQRLDILVNVVGGVRQSLFDDTSPPDWDGDIVRNYRYALQSIHLALPRMRRGGQGGSIVNFTTIEAGRGAAGFSVYAGAKAALENFGRALAVELAAEHIRVNTLAPDTTPSRGNREAIAARPAGEATDAQRAASMATYIPMGTPPMPEDLADGVLFLVSDLAKFVTGTTLHVDGGTWASSGFLRWPDGDGWLPVPGPVSATRLFPDS
jgi:NAD(P)-dependent dehydrogenase (short-subunit alcohol dehydrogenase family)